MFLTYLRQEGILGPCCFTFTQSKVLPLESSKNSKTQATLRDQVNHNLWELDPQVILLGREVRERSRGIDEYFLPYTPLYHLNFG